MHKHLFLLTSLMYEKMRHPWEHVQCQKLYKQLLADTQIPQPIKNMLQQKDTNGLTDYLFANETYNGDYFGENLSDDSDSELEEEFNQREFLHRETASQKALGIRNKIAINMLNSLLAQIIKVEELKHKLYLGCCGEFFYHQQMSLTLQQDMEKFKAFFASPNKNIFFRWFSKKRNYRSI